MHCSIQGVATSDHLPFIAIQNQVLMGSCSLLQAWTSCREWSDVDGRCSVLVPRYKVSRQACSCHQTLKTDRI